MQHSDDSFTFTSDGDDRWIVETSSGWVTVVILANGRCEITPDFWLNPTAVTVRAALPDVLGALRRLVTTERRSYATLQELAAKDRNRGSFARMVRGVALVTAGLVIAGLVIAALITGQLA